MPASGSAWPPASRSAPAPTAFFFGASWNGFVNRAPEQLQEIRPLPGSLNAFRSDFTGDEVAVDESPRHLKERFTLAAAQLGQGQLGVCRKTRRSTERGATGCVPANPATQGVGPCPGHRPVFQQTPRRKTNVSTAGARPLAHLVQIWNIPRHADDRRRASPMVIVCPAAQRKQRRANICSVAEKSSLHHANNSSQIPLFQQHT